MKILITGHRGYLGSHIHRFLLRNYRDAEVIAFDEDKSSMAAYRDSVDRCVDAEFTSCYSCWRSIINDCELPRCV